MVPVHISFSLDQSSEKSKSLSHRHQAFLCIAYFWITWGLIPVIASTQRKMRFPQLWLCCLTTQCAKQCRGNAEVAAAAASAA
jgi:hypothetical protein